MSWIHTISNEDATGALKKSYDMAMDQRGKLSNIMQVQSLYPRAMQAHLDLYMAVMFADSGLSREDRELLALVVSAANGCSYCVRHHAEALGHYWKDEGRVQRLIDDAASVTLSERQNCMVDYARTLTLHPSEMQESDVDRLRRQRLRDEDILAVNLIVSYFNFVNRIALGLGVEYTEDEATGYRY
ncbi:MAG: peroxidase-related enzyme [Thermoplasmatota archaeon]